MITRLLILMVLCGPVHAANCAARDTVTKRLKHAYSEEFKVGGLQVVRSRQSIMEVWANDETGTYTVLLTEPNGISCVVASGTNFFKAVPKDDPKDDPT